MANVIELELGGCTEPAQIMYLLAQSLHLAHLPNSLPELADCMSEPLGDVVLKISGVKRMPPSLQGFFFDMMDVFDDATRSQRRWQGCEFDYRLL